MGKRVVVIGAGASGLTAIKECKDEGLDVICYERTDNWGGLWRYRDDDMEGVASVMRTTIINSSKEMSSFSDFIPPKEFPNYMHNKELIRYFGMYAEKFNLLPHIYYSHEVLKVEKAKDYDKTGRWAVSVKNRLKDEILEEIFDGVMVCIGHHVFPNVPTFSGLEDFKGKAFHTHSFKDPTLYKGTTAVVIGIGNSAVDAVVDLSYVCDKVYLSTRRGSWLNRRVGPGGLPSDSEKQLRILDCIRKKLPINFVNWFLENEASKQFDYETYGLKPDHRFLGQHPTVTDALPSRILSGIVVVKGDIKRFTERGVIFDGDREETEVDIVILATGYHIKFPFLSEDTIEVKNNRVMLYKYVFPPKLIHPSLAIIGLIQPIGAIFPISEIQSRWFALLMNKKLRLQKQEDLLEDIRIKNEANAIRYANSPRHTIQVDWIPYMDEIAAMIGAKPDFLVMALTDPVLYWKCITGPCIPAQYRLKGPHTWSKAREAIMSVEERILAPLQTRSIKNSSSNEFGLFSVIKTLFILIVLLGMWEIIF